MHRIADGSGTGPRGRLEITVQAPDGRVVERRRTTNIVLRGGAELIAQRFAGVASAGPIDRIKIGFGTDVATTDVTTLTPPAAVGIPASALETALDPAAFTITNDQHGKVSVAVSALFTPTLDLVDVTEAALAAKDRLYNQVVFEPLHLRVGQNVTFFWEIEFPFG